MLKYINSKKRKRIASIASFIAFLVLAGSVYLFFNLFKENQFKQHANRFIKDIKKSGISIIDESSKNINYGKRSIKLVIYGEILEESELLNLKKRLPEYGLKGTTLNIQQGADDSDLRHDVKNLTNLYTHNQKIIYSRDESIKEKEEKIQFLESEISKYFNNKIPFLEISEEAQINYTGLAQLSYANVISTNFKTIDTITVFNAKWHDSIKNTQQQEIQLKQWLKTRLKLDTLVVTRN
jgi:hypothetical protein